MNVSDSEPEKVDSNDEWEEQDPGDLLGPISSSEEEEGVDKWTQRTLLFHFESRFCLCHQSEKYG
jgi:hypothetical protein